MFAHNEDLFVTFWKTIYAFVYLLYPLCLPGTLLRSGYEETLSLAQVDLYLGHTSTCKEN